MESPDTELMVFFSCQSGAALLRFMAGTVPKEEDQATIPDNFFGVGTLIEEETAAFERKISISFQELIRITST